MGTDIHPVVQVRRDGAWQTVEIPKEDRYGNILDHRHYDLFAILGNVRNGFGFAGVVTGSGFVPISDSRGIPEDAGFTLDESGSILCAKHRPASEAGTEVAVLDGEAEDDRLDSIYECGECLWLGDHSHTWVTLRELEDYDWDAPVAKAGVIEGFPDRRSSFCGYSYVEWMKEPDFLTAMPHSYSGGISGGGYVDITEQDFQAILRGTAPRDPDVHYVVAFARRMTVREVMSTFLADEGPLGWLRSLGKPDDVRIVMGFDS